MKCLSVIIPLFNEEENIPLIYTELTKVLSGLSYSYEILFVDDGSSDESLHAIKTLKEKDSKVKIFEFSRNFGKEIATTAGLHQARGDAAIIIDADLQHPSELIPDFVKAWEQGADVVVGIRNKSKSDSRLKKLGSYFFYRVMNSISDTEVIPGETDFRLLDRMVINEFNKLTEHSRLTRGLINWLGFKRAYIYFDANERQNGTSSFSVIKLTRLAISSFVSHSLLPLRLGGYIGGLIIICSGALGIFMFADRYILHTHFDFSGPAILADIILFLVGIILVAIGILAVYIGNIHHEVQNRPLYIIRKEDNNSERKQ